MLVRQTPDEYLFHLEVTSPGDAKRLWRERIKENWGHSCAYCGATENLSLDHVKPRSLGGQDVSKNVVCACVSCNQSKGHLEWKEWYYEQDFFSWERMHAVQSWVQEPKAKPSYTRRNICYGTVGQTDLKLA